jgi:putative membrane protein
LMGAGMGVLGNLLILIVGLLHVGFMIMEMFFWQHPVIVERFGMTPGQAAASAALAANQGLYNGFLAAGLFWSVFARDGLRLKVFFLVCVIMAGVFGALTAKMTILYIQAAPAALALLLVWASRPREEA